MNGILDYRPQLSYKRKIKAILTNYQITLGTPSDEPLAAPASEQLVQQYAGSPYQPSPAVLDMVDITPTDVVTSMANASGKIDAVIDSIVKNLKDRVTFGVSIADYIKAREENSTDVLHAFEDYHHDHIEGSTEAEVLPILYHFQDELESLKEFVGSYLYSDELSQDFDYLLDQLDRLRNQEEENITQLIADDRSYLLDTEEVQEKNHILGFLYERAQSLYDFAEEVEVLISDNRESIYHGSGKRIALLAAQQSVLREQFHLTNQNHFAKQRENTSDAYQRMTRLVTRGYKKRLLEETVKKQKEKLGSRQALQIMHIVNPEQEHDPMNIFLSDVADTIQETKEYADQLVDDLYKITELEHYQNIDYLVSLQKKNQCRHIHSILTDVEMLNMEGRNTDTEVEKLFV